MTYEEIEAIPFATITGEEVKVGDDITPLKPWQSGYWKVTQIKGTNMYLYNLVTGMSGMSTTAINYRRRIEYMQYDPNQQGDTEEDI